MTRKITFTFVGTLAALSMGCGSVTTTSKSAFKLRMVALYSQPPGATGTDSPQSQTFLFKALTLTNSAGTKTSLYTDTAKTFKIIDRPQVLYTNEDMSAYDGSAFSQATVEFDPAVIVNTRKGTALNLAISSGTLDLVETFTISKSQNQTLTIKASWGKTITEAADGTETASAPTFSMVYSHD